MRDSIKLIKLRLLGFIINAMVMVFSIFCIYPFIWMLYSSLKTEAEFSQNIISLPEIPQFSNYIKAIHTGKLAYYSVNSLYNCIITVTIVVIAGFVAAYFLARFDFKGRNLIYMTFMAGMLILYPLYKSQTNEQ